MVAKDQVMPLTLPDFPLSKFTTWQKPGKKYFSLLLGEKNIFVFLDYSYDFKKLEKEIVSFFRSILLPIIVWIVWFVEKIWVYIFDGRGGGSKLCRVGNYRYCTGARFFIVNLNSIFLTLRLTEACYVHEEKKIVKVIATISYNSY